MKVFKIIGMVLLVGLVGIQFMPTKRNQSNVVFDTDFLLVNHTPENVGKIVRTSCYDCHSNHTEYPWYSKVQPAAWLMESHITDGKKELNFSEWEDYSDRRKNSKLRSIISQIEKDEMPLFSYTLLHRNAVLSDHEKKLLIDYMTKVKENL